MDVIIARRVLLYKFSYTLNVLSLMHRTIEVRFCDFNACSGSMIVSESKSIYVYMKFLYIDIE